MLAIDTNVIVRHLTGDHREQAPRRAAARLTARTNAGRPITSSHVSLLARMILQTWDRPMKHAQIPNSRISSCG